MRKKLNGRVLAGLVILSVVLLVTASTFSSHLKRAAEGAVMDSDYDICFCPSTFKGTSRVKFAVCTREYWNENFRFST